MADKFTKLLIEGAKHYAEKNYELAVDDYGDLNQLYDSENEVPNPDYLFLYGKALYQFALSRADVFGMGSNVKRQGDAEEEDDEKGQNESGSKGSGLIQFAEEEEEEEEEEEDGDDENDEDDEDEEEEGERQDDNDDDEDEEHEHDKDDFENAWDILELSRSCYEAKLEEHPDNKELKLKLSECYDLLGEVSLESENFPQASHDFEECLKLRKELLEAEDPIDRSIIESYYKISLALEFDPNQFEKCKSNLTQCIKLLKQRCETVDKDDEDQKDLLNELQTKLKELDDSEAQMQSLKNDLLSTIHSVTAPAASQATDASVNDLTSMVKKRKSDKEADGKINALKKPKN
ncbi:unnamed protein product [Kluyveromyces dobzhanskii CBS 2104]|uniref:WGS project CCBQ000000000 data, contig 00099 n=1 Tax=Kluyveromyces dobzhanskii CBS 2104 TaxID=1427455 RepID=A0A0A8L4B6_9SACH|nr:unnamed protein product [Kluyveromyces dobzhanskii CBS 2104]